MLWTATSSTASPRPSKARPPTWMAWPGPPTSGGPRPRRNVSIKEARRAARAMQGGRPGRCKAGGQGDAGASARQDGWHRLCISLSGPGADSPFRVPSESFPTIPYPSRCRPPARRIAPGALTPLPVPGLRGRETPACGAENANLFVV